MSASAVQLYIDIQSQPGRVVGGLAGQTSTPLSGLYQGSHLNLNIFPVRPTGTIAGGNAYSLVPLASFGDIKVAIGTRAGTGTVYAQAGAGTSYPFTAQTSTDSDGQSGYFWGELNLNTTALNSALATADYVDAYLEIHLSIGGVYRVVYQTNVRIFAAVIDPSGAIALPLAASEYYTRAEAEALFVKWDNRLAANYGKNVILASPAGTHTREIGVSDAGEPLENLT